MRRRRWRLGLRTMGTGSSSSSYRDTRPSGIRTRISNNDLKGGINATGLPDGNEELRSRILGFMIKLLHLPEHVRSYFQHPCVQYAAGV